jgi:hypothetical protein
MMDRTKPPPGWEHYIGDEYIYAWAHEAAHYASGFDGVRLDEAWRIYDAETMPACVALLRELAAEMRANAAECNDNALRRAVAVQAAIGHGIAESWKDIANDYDARADALEKTTEHQSPMDTPSDGAT